MATTTADWIEELKSISVLELSERIKALEEEFGVSATAVAAAAPAGGGAGDGAPAEEEQSTVRRHRHRPGRQEDPGDQGRPRRHGPGPQGGQGARRRGAQARQGGHRARRGRQAQGRARGGRRERRGQVARATAHLPYRGAPCRAPLARSGSVRDALASPRGVYCITEGEKGGGGRGASGSVRAGLARRPTKGEFVGVWPTKSPIVRETSADAPLPATSVDFVSVRLNNTTLAARRAPTRHVQRRLSGLSAHTRQTRQASRRRPPTHRGRPPAPRPPLAPFPR